MSFVLPGNARSLRFTGEAKALSLPKPDTSSTGSVALGKPRIRKPPPPPTPAPVIAAPRINTPVPQSRPQPNFYGAESPVIRHQQLDSTVGNGGGNNNGEHFPDDNPTMGFDRDGLDVMPGGGFHRSQTKPAPFNPNPIPNFRPIADPSIPMVGMGHHGHRPLGTGSQRSNIQQPTGGAPLAVWIFASLLAGIVSYFVLPSLVLRDPPSAATRVQSGNP